MKLLDEYISLLRFLKGHMRTFCFAAFFMLISAIFSGLEVSLLMPLIDISLTDKSIVLPEEAPKFLYSLVEYLNSFDRKRMFMILIFGFPIALLFKHIVNFGYGFLMNDISQAIMRDIRSNIFKKIHSLSMDYFSQKRTGELISRITNDVQTIENAVSYGVTDLVQQPLLIMVYLTIVFSIYLKGALILFLILPFIIWPMAIIGRRLRSLSKGYQEKMADINSHLLETISGVRVVKAFSTENYEVERFRKQNHDLYKLRMKSIKRILSVSPITEIVTVLSASFLFYFLGMQVIEEKLSFGLFATFLLSFLSIIRPFKKLANVHAIAQQALAANERIYEVLNTEASVLEKNDAKDLPMISQSIHLDHVDFAYSDDSDQVLFDVDLKINAGELVAIVGPTGSGKSTLVNLIPRFYDVDKGNVLIDGVNVKDVSFKSIRQQVGIVSQEAILFNDTVRNNIVYGNFDSTDVKVIEAAKQAFADHFIQKMPQGYETMVGDRGFRLSGGEKQRLTIARAIVKNPPILILDEATSQLDSESEKAVQDALDLLMQGRTVIAIAHRLSTILKADNIIVLEQGKIVGQGKHEALLESCPLYKRLYETQFAQ